MADISSLGAQAEFEPLDLDNYADAKATPPLPKAGEYVVQAPPTFPSTAFGRTQKGALSVQVDPTIVGPSGEGYTIRFTKVSAKPFPRDGKQVSQLGDYLRACGIRGRLASEQEQADAVESTANRQYKVRVDWRAYNKNTGFSVEGMTRFPSDGNGGYTPLYPDPTEKNEDGTPKMLRANLIVTRYIAAAE